MLIEPIYDDPTPWEECGSNSSAPSVRFGKPHPERPKRVHRSHEKRSAGLARYENSYSSCTILYVKILSFFSAKSIKNYIFVTIYRNFVEKVARV